MMQNCRHSFVVASRQLRQLKSIKSRASGRVTQGSRSLSLPLFPRDILTYVFSLRRAALSRGINLPVYLSTFSRRLLHTPSRRASKRKKKRRSCQRLHRFLSHFCAYLLDSSPAKAEQHNLFNCRLTIDALAAFTINYGSVESSAEFHYAAKPARLQEQLHERRTEATNRI